MTPKTIENTPKISNRWSWVLQGLFFGFFMFLIMGVALPYSESKLPDVWSLSRSFVYWMVAGLLLKSIIYFVTKFVERRPVHDLDQ